MLEDLLRYCETERHWVLETTMALARLESPTSDKAAVDRCGVELAQRMLAIGGVVNRLEQPEAGDHLRAEFGTGVGQVLLVGHFDTVWPVGQIGKMPLELRDGCLFGPGVLDMKGGIAIGMLAARALTEVTSCAGRIVMLWTSDEERGSGSSRSVIEREALQSNAVFVLEPGLLGGAVKTARKGCGEFRLKVHGVAAHAGVEPDQGSSAVHELAAQIVDLQRLRAVAAGVSLNVGVIAGGTRPNVVAEEASATVDIRVETAEEAERVEMLVRQRTTTVPGTRIEVDGGFSRPPLERTDAVAHLYHRARGIAARLGQELREGSTGGGSDGNFTAALGVPTLDGLGAVGGGAHALHEHIEVEALCWRAALLAALVAETHADAESLG
ncbi:MAG: M20 family metallopeptidase [Acidobacteriota bacterium]|nr:M20 family metallopeptidase [Acidobacteriota bacterium]